MFVFQNNTNCSVFFTYMLDSFKNQRQFYTEEYNFPTSQKSKYFIKKIAHLVFYEEKKTLSI